MIRPSEELGVSFRRFRIWSSVLKRTWPVAVDRRIWQNGRQACVCVCGAADLLRCDCWLWFVVQLACAAWWWSVPPSRAARPGGAAAAAQPPRQTAQSRPDGRDRRRPCRRRSRHAQQGGGHRQRRPTAGPHRRAVRRLPPPRPRPRLGDQHQTVRRAATRRRQRLRRPRQHRPHRVTGRVVPADSGGGTAGTGSRQGHGRRNGHGHRRGCLQRLTQEILLPCPSGDGSWFTYRSVAATAQHSRPRSKPSVE